MSGWCSYYKEAPKCPKCGAYSALLDRETRFCSECGWKTSTTEKEKQYFDSFTKSSY